MQPTVMQYVVAGLVLTVVGLAAVPGYRRWRRRETERRRLQRVTAIAYDHLQDVLVPDGNEGQLHVDFLLLTAAGALVVDMRDVPGLIFGSESMDDWTVMDGTRRATFANPLGPLFDRVAAVKQLAGKELPVEGRVLFAPGGTFPKGRPPQVALLEALGDEFPPADRSIEPSPVAHWAAEWEALRAAVVPSPAVRRR